MNNWFNLEAAFRSCDSASKGFSRIIAAELNGGGVISSEDNFKLHIRINECLSHSVNIPSNVYLSGRFFQTALDPLSRNPNSQFNLTEKYLNKELVTLSDVRTGNGIWIKRQSKCWPSDGLLETNCPKNNKDISFSFPLNGVACNRYWQLRLELKSIYSDQETIYSSEYLLDDILVVCPPDTLGLYSPVLLSTPLKYIPGHVSFSYLETTVTETLQEGNVLNLDEASENYLLETRYQDCRLSSASQDIPFMPAKCETSSLGRL